MICISSDNASEMTNIARKSSRLIINNHKVTFFVLYLGFHILYSVTWLNLHINNIHCDCRFGTQNKTTAHKEITISNVKTMENMHYL